MEVQTAERPQARSLRRAQQTPLGGDSIEAATVRRVFDARRLNEIVNHPSVRPFVADAGEGVLDLSRQVADRNNILLMGRHGCTMFFKLMAGIYEVHTQVLDVGRGAWALSMVRAASTWMFTRTDAYEIVTRVPHGHRAALGLTVTAGMRLEMSLPNACKYLGEKTSVDIYSFRIQDWVAKARGLEQTGRRFHDDMTRAVRAAGITEPAHEDDPVHNRYVGAAYEMFRHGQAAKGTDFYNRWCQIARHVPISLLAIDPPTIRFDVGLLRLIGEKVEVVKC